MDISHLPADLRDGITAYEAKIANGQITFDSNGYAHDPYPADQDNQRQFLLSKLPASDVIGR